MSRTFPRPAILLVLGVLAVVVAAGVTPRAQTKPELALKAAMDKEVVDGDLQGAIQMYRKLASGSDRAVAARALVRMGQCYEKLGEGQVAQAKAAYERVVREFSDQSVTAAEARTRLAALAAPAMKPTFTKIRVPTKLPRFTEMALSPDGQQLAYGGTGGGVWLMPVHGSSGFEIAGAARRIARIERRWSYVNSIRWSRDGNWITLHVWERLPEGGDDAVIYMVPSAGGELTRIPLELKDYVEDYWDNGISLSPDGAWLAYTTSKGGQSADAGQRRVYLTPTKGGSPRALTPPPSREPAFSPDGKRIAYVGLMKVESLRADRLLGRQGWVIPTEGGPAQLVYELSTPGSLSSPVWSPDGTVLTFLVRPRAFSTDATHFVFVHVTPEGRPAGSPIEITLPQVTTHSLPGWGTDNRIGLAFRSPEVSALYTVPASGGKAVQITASEAYMPSWARDGSRLYVGTVDPSDPGVYLASVPASGGKLTRIPIKSNRPFSISMPDGGVSLSPDGSKILFIAYYLKPPGEDVSHFLTVSVGGGELTEVPTGMPWVYQPVWSPDGASIAFISSEGVPNANSTVDNVYTMPLKGGTPPQRLTSTTDRVLESSGLAWSPDGKSIAYYSVDMKLKLVPAAGGPSKVLVEGLKGYLDDAGLAWSPDGRELAYFSQEKIFRLNLVTGTSVEVATGLDAHLMTLAWSPDGKTMAFSGFQGGEPELWLMDNFLPLLKAPPRK